MKKNIIKKLIYIPAVTLLLTACNESDFLDLKNPNSQVDKTFWISEANAQKAMATIYSPIRGQMYGYYGGYTGWHTMNRADDTWFILGEEMHNWEPATFTNTAGTKESDWGRLYNGVQRANEFIYQVPNVPMDENKRNELIGEAKFLRGMYYFLLVSNFGDVPLRTVPSNSDSEAMMIASSPEAEVWKQVEEDFKEAEKYLPVERDASELGRATRGAAIAYLGKTYIYQKKYAEAEAELKKVMEAPYTYDLVDNPDDNFDENTEFNKESIFELVYDGQYGTDGIWGSENPNSPQGFIICNFVGPQGTGGWFKWMPTASIVDEFMVEERAAGADTKFDKRMYTSLFWKYTDFEPGATDGKWFGDMPFDLIWENCATKRLRGEPDFSTVNGTKGRFLIRKFTNFYKNEPDANNMYDASTRNNNLRLMRFSEVLLMHAEACIKNGNLTEAADDLNRIRKRAGLEQKTWSGADAMWKEMIHQNALEFFFEGHRFFDLKRWYSYDEMKQIFVQNQKQGANNFQPKHFYLPIPQSELDNNTSIQQHPLWR